jgi:DNA polymerase-3 subunit beta
MKVSVNKSELVSALKLVSKAKEKNTATPILDEFLIKAEHGKITVVAGSFDTMVEVDIPLQNNETFSFMVSNNQVKLIEKLGDVVSFDFHDGVLEMSSGRDKQKSTPYDTNDYPVMTLSEVSCHVDILDSNLFVERISKAKKFTSKDELRPAICGININGNENKIDICATDAHRLYVSSLEAANTPEFDFICRSNISDILSSIKKIGKISITLASKYVLFEIDGNIRIKSKVVDERYPNYRSVIPQNNQQSEIIKDDLLSIVEKAKLFANKATNKVTFLFSGNSLNISSEDLDYGHDYSSTMDCWNNNIESEFKIAFNANYLTSLIKEIDCKKVVLLTSEPNRGCTIKGGNELYLLMPVMI